MNLYVTYDDEGERHYWRDESEITRDDFIANHGGMSNNQATGWRPGPPAPRPLPPPR